MKLSDIQTMWQKDCQIDDTKLDIELLKLPNLHSKYLGIYNDESLSEKKLFFENKKLIKYKTIWYAGKMSEEELEELGWEQFKIKLIKGYEPKIETYLQGDDDLIEANQKLAYQKIKVEFLESIIKSLNTRGYNIKSAIDFLRFTMGQ
ncbi:MAG: recombination mediator protein UvsY [Candidatus Neomarinimicrobiota bacterium]|nr:recombination mediator protein UvsY [Candidatus Neomarinimicrobiota bacterium]